MTSLLYSSSRALFSTSAYHFYSHLLSQLPYYGSHLWKKVNHFHQHKPQPLFNITARFKAKSFRQITMLLRNENLYLSFLFNYHLSSFVKIQFFGKSYIYNVLSKFLKRLVCVQYQTSGNKSFRISFEFYRTSRFLYSFWAKPIWRLVTPGINHLITPE